MDSAASNWARRTAVKISARPFTGTHPIATT